MAFDAKKKILFSKVVVQHSEPIRSSRVSQLSPLQILKVIAFCRQEISNTNRNTCCVVN